MNYDEATALKNQLSNIVGVALIVSTDWIIDRLVVLPEETDTREVYIRKIEILEPNWKITGFDHEQFYKQSGIYKHYDGRTFFDELIIFTVLKNKKMGDYKLVALSNLVEKGEVLI